MSMHASNKGDKFRGTVMTPLGWTCSAFEAVLLPTAVTVAHYHIYWLVIWCMVLASFILAAYIGIFVYFMITNPRYLHSERFRLEQERMLYAGVGEIKLSANDRNSFHRVLDQVDQGNFQALTDHSE